MQLKLTQLTRRSSVDGDNLTLFGGACASQHTLLLLLKLKGNSSPSILLLLLVLQLLLLWLRYANVVVVAPATINPPNSFQLVAPCT
jgi:hypothetical protein